MSQTVADPKRATERFFARTPIQGTNMAKDKRRESLNSPPNKRNLSDATSSHDPGTALFQSQLVLIGGHTTRALRERENWKLRGKEATRCSPPSLRIKDTRPDPEQR